MSGLTRDEVIDRLARLMRDRFAPEFVDAPPPEWATLAAADIIDYHQPMLRDVLLAEAFANGLRAGRSEAAPSTPEPSGRKAVHDAIERIVENELTGVPHWRIGLTNRLTDAALRAAPSTEPALNGLWLTHALHDEMNFRIGIPDPHPEGAAVDEPTCQLLAAHLIARLAESQP